MSIGLKQVAGIANTSMKEHAGVKDLKLRGIRVWMILASGFRENDDSVTVQIEDGCAVDKYIGG